MKRYIVLLITTLLISVSNKAQQNPENEFSNIEELNQYLIQKAALNEFSGVVLIAKDGEAIFEKAVGFASKKFNVENTIETKFNIGSISKHLTSIAIVKLNEKGLVDLDDPIGKYLDMFPSDVAQKITIRHLLTMSSGWGDYWENEYFLSHKYEMRKVSDYINFIKDIPLDFEPGSKVQHCNTGFEVAGAIIEKVSGENYYEYIRNSIYKPTGMLNSDSYDIDGPVKFLAEGYTNEHPDDSLKTGFLWSNTYFRLPPRGTPTGGSYSTVRDLLRLEQAQRNFKLLSKNNTNHLLNLFQGKLGDPFMMKKGIIHIVGGAEGVGAVLGMDMMDDDMSKGYTIIILSNYDFPVAMDLYTKVKKLVLKLKKE